MIYVVESDRDLFVRVTVAEFLVESEVLSTLPRPTSPLTIPVGVLITGLVSVLFVSVCVADLPTDLSEPVISPSL